MSRTRKFIRRATSNSDSLDRQGAYDETVEAAVNLELEEEAAHADDQDSGPGSRRGRDD